MVLLYTKVCWCVEGYSYMREEKERRNGKAFWGLYGRTGKECGRENR